MERHFLSIKEFATATGRQRNAVEKWIKEGKLLSSKIGKKVLIPIEELERLKQGCTA